ncbi:MAG TPA: hypothetical protein VGO47_03075, partial [Chlamydiales bacterium]|nr:hypothetical protein [Chlamydiales bacterium]
MIVGIILEGLFTYITVAALEGTQTAHVQRNSQERLEITLTTNAGTETGKVRTLTATMIILTYVGPYNHQFICELICLLCTLSIMLISSSSSRHHSDVGPCYHSWRMAIH